jgi:putative AdoMet-dependent methyltransferase
MITDKRLLYNEFLHPGVDFADSREVEAYDSYMQKLRTIGPEVEKVRAAVGLAAGDTVLDIGAGTGEMAIGLAAHCRQVIAVDVSAAMVEYAADKARRRACRSATFRQAGFLTFEQPPASLDVVISQFALHHLPDFWKFIALRRVYAALKPGGRFLLQDAVLPGGVADYQSYLTEVIAKIEAVAGDKVARDAEQSFREEYVTLDWIMGGLLAKAGFKLTREEYGAPFIGTYLCIK